MQQQIPNGLNHFVLAQQEYILENPKQLRKCRRKNVLTLSLCSLEFEIETTISKHILLPSFHYFLVEFLLWNNGKRKLRMDENENEGKGQNILLAPAHGSISIVIYVFAFNF